MAKWLSGYISDWYKVKVAREGPFGDQGMVEGVASVLFSVNKHCKVKAIVVKLRSLQQAANSFELPLMLDIAQYARVCLR